MSKLRPLTARADRSPRVRAVGTASAIDLPGWLKGKPAPAAQVAQSSSPVAAATTSARTGADAERAGRAALPRHRAPERSGVSSV
jgi:hypothetical protein